MKSLCFNSQIEMYAWSGERAVWHFEPHFEWIVFNFLCNRASASPGICYTKWRFLCLRKNEIQSTVVKPVIARNYGPTEKPIRISKAV